MSLEDLVERSVSMTMRHPWRTATVALLAVVVGLLGVSTARVDTTLVGMVGGAARSADALARVADGFAATDEIMLLVSAPSGMDIAMAQAELAAFAGRFAEAAASDAEAGEMIERVTYRPREAFERYVREVVVPAGVHYLDDTEFHALLQRLEPEAVRAQLDQNEAMLAAPGPGAGALAKELVKDPLRLRDFLRGAVVVDDAPSGGEFSDDGRSLLIRVAGRRPVIDIEFSKSLTALVQRLITQAGAGELRAQVGGGYAIAAASATSIKSDAIFSTLSTLGMLLLFFIAAYRNPLTGLAMILAASVGITLAFGAYASAARVMTPLTAVAASMLADLGVDYAIHLRARHESLVREGRSPAEAALGAARELSVPILGAFGTTVIAFGVIALSGVGMLRDFAILGCAGLAGAVVSVLLTLPLALRRFRVPTRPSPIDALARWSVGLGAAHPRVMLWASLVVLLGSVVMIVVPTGDGGSFETDPSVMHPRPNPALDASERIKREFGAHGESLLVLVEGESSNELLARCHDIRRGLTTQEIRDAGVRGTVGLADLLPDPRASEARLAELGALDVPGIIGSVRGEFEASVFEPGAFDDFMDFLATLLSAREPPGLEALDDFPEIGALFLARAGDRDAAAHEAIVIVRMSHVAAAGSEVGSARADTFERIRAALAPVDGATLTGVSVVASDLEASVRRDIVKFSVCSVLGALAWLVVMFRRALDVVLALSPVALSLCFMVGVMSVTGQRFNLVNVIAIPLLAGVSVDSGILLVSAARRAAGTSSAAGTRSSVRAALTPAVHGALLTAGTTVIAFGSLAFTHTPAVQSLGVAVILGILASLMASLWLLTPALLLRSGTDEGGHG